LSSHTLRTFDERLALRLPMLAALLARGFSRLAPRSRIRTALLWRAARLGLDAFNRRDLDAVAISYGKDFEYVPARAWVEAGMVEPCYRGLDGYRRYVATVDEVWGGENYLALMDVIDEGEQVLLLAHGSMRAQASGVPWSESFALLLTYRDGRVIRAQEYYDHTEAIAALRARQPS
jgi:ketosteroid isomerase-like protein